MTMVADPRTRMLHPVTRCRSCQAPVFFAYTEKGKLCPFNVVDGQPTTESHFKTCPVSRLWTKKKPAAVRAR